MRHTFTLFQKYKKVNALGKSVHALKINRNIFLGGLKEKNPEKISTMREWCMTKEISI